MKEALYSFSVSVSDDNTDGWPALRIRCNCIYQQIPARTKSETLGGTPPPRP